MDLKDIKNKKSHRRSGAVLAVTGLVLSFIGFLSFQQASADIGGYFDSSFGVILIACGAALILAAVVTFVFILTND